MLTHVCIYLTHTPRHTHTYTFLAQLETEFRFLSWETKIYSSLLRPENRHSQMIHSLFKVVNREYDLCRLGNIITCLVHTIVDYERTEYYPHEHHLSKRWCIVKLLSSFRSLDEGWGSFDWCLVVFSRTMVLIMSCCLLKFWALVLNWDHVASTSSFIIHFSLVSSQFITKWELYQAPSLCAMQMEVKWFPNGNLFQLHIPSACEGHHTIIAWHDSQTFVQSLKLLNHIKVSLHIPSCPSLARYFS